MRDDVLAARAQPRAPRRSKHASWGLAATQAGPAASMPRQCAATAAAARSAGTRPWAPPLGLRPEPRGVGVEPQDDLGLALGDEGLQPVGEMQTGRRPAVLRVAGPQR